MADEPVRVVFDCSIPDRDAVVAYTQDQVEAVLKSRVDGKITSEEAAARLVELADLATTAAGIPDRVQIVPFTDEEIAQRDKDIAEEEARAAEPAPPTQAERVAAAIAGLPELSKDSKAAVLAALDEPDAPTTTSVVR